MDEKSVEKRMKEWGGGGCASLLAARSASLVGSAARARPPRASEMLRNATRRNNPRSGDHLNLARIA